MRATLNEDIESAIANEKYGFISGALAETYTPGDKEEARSTTRLIDSFVTNKLFGFPIFHLSSCGSCSRPPSRWGPTRWRGLRVLWRGCRGWSVHLHAGRAA